MICRACRAEVEFAKAFALCARSFHWLQQLPRLHIRSQLLAAVDGLYSDTLGFLGEALQGCCLDFDPSIYRKVSFL